jgi:hypothetical protein
MAKVIKYKFLSSEVNHGTEENPVIEQVIYDKSIICPTQEIFDGNYPIAEKEAIENTIEIEGEFDPVPVAEPTADEILNAMLGVNRYA